MKQYAGASPVEMSAGGVAGMKAGGTPQGAAFIVSAQGHPFTAVHAPSKAKARFDYAMIVGVPYIETHIAKADIRRVVAALLLGGYEVTDSGECLLVGKPGLRSTNPRYVSKQGIIAHGIDYAMEAIA